MSRFRNAFLVLSGIVGCCTANVAFAFIGTLAIGLGEIDQEIGRIQTAFSAEGVFETEEFTGNAKVHYAPGKIRDELNMGPQNMVMIRRMDINKLWMIMGQGMYMDVDPDQGSDQAPEYELVSRERMGSESVNGIPATKYKSVYKSKDGKFGGFTWYTDDNIAVKGFLIHEQKGDKQSLKFEFTSLDRGQQAASLFELPPGAKPFNMASMMGMSPEQMRQMQSQMGGAQGGQIPGGFGQPDQGDANNSGNSNTGDSFASEVAEEAQRTAEDTAKDEAMRGVRDSVKKGIGKLFGR